MKRGSSRFFSDLYPQISLQPQYNLISTNKVVFCFPCDKCRREASFKDSSYFSSAPNMFSSDMLGPTMASLVSGVPYFPLTEGHDKTNGCSLFLGFLLSFPLCRALHWVTPQMLCVPVNEEISEVSDMVVKAITGQ